MACLELMVTTVCVCVCVCVCHCVCHCVWYAADVCWCTVCECCQLAVHGTPTVVHDGSRVQMPGGSGAVYGTLIVDNVDRIGCFSEWNR